MSEHDRIDHDPPSPPSASGRGGSFPDNPIVYFAMTDRFHRGAGSPGDCYGRRGDGEREIGTFHGGNIAGIREKLEEGWFTRLGVNALWISAPYEQIHGWVRGANCEFRHYAYHGYWALDFTVMDANFGTRAELRQMIDLAHEQGIRVLFDVVMNHPGYADLLTLEQLLPAAVRGAVADATLDTYGDHFAPQADALEHWWGGDWVRADLPGYPPPGSDELTMQLAGLPDFLTESTKAVTLPPFLRDKPGTAARDLPDTTVRGYLVAWLSQWVRDFGVDGFRCDSVKHVEAGAWRELKLAAVAALAQWKAANPAKKIDDAPFWMVGEVFGNGVERNAYFDDGFDNLINFQFQGEISAIFAASASGIPCSPSLAFFKVDGIYRRYAAALAGRPDHNVLSYISSHDTRLFSRASLIDGGTALMLVPGGVHLFYGDETARPPGPFTPSEVMQATRSDMNWDAIDTRVLSHWRRLGRFRARHVAIARGVHRRLAHDPYVFSRRDEASGDCVLVAIGSAPTLTLHVGALFGDASRLRDAYSGKLLDVADGVITIALDGLALIERMEQDEHK